MKKCERCGASNAERARFCSNCAAPFALDDAPSASTKTLVETAKTASPEAPLPATFADAAPSSGARLESSDDFYRALATIFATFGRIVAFLFGGVILFFKRCCVALWRSSEPSRTRFFSGVGRFGRDAAGSFAAIFTPSSRWLESEPPNFLLPSLVLFFLWTRPCALVAVVYSILSSEARQTGALTAARRRAVSARNWIFLELLCVALKAFCEAFDMSLPILKRLFF
ncbi:MAG: zinc ribbon domain-containing protein [Thermoguttaceae bacterium]|nr:zinc ribbon domain-containing protein [Thermoguttaceae bacterium]